jgi:hypothetical protein
VSAFSSGYDPPLLLSNPAAPGREPSPRGTSGSTYKFGDRNKRKNDRLDANKLARLGRVDPQSLFPIEHRSTQVRQDLVVLRARDTWCRCGRN